MKYKFLLALGILIQSLVSNAQTAYLDSTFNPSGAIKGKKIVDFGSYEEGTAIAIDPQGRLLVLAQDIEGSGIYVARLRTNGDLDFTFGTDGIYSRNSGGESEQAYFILLQPDGRILIGGSKYDLVAGEQLPMVIRLNSNGTLDSTFGNSGLATFNFDSGTEYQQVKKMVLQSDGRIIILGTKSNGIFIARLTTMGALDLSYNSGNGYRYESIVESYNPGVDINNSDNLMISVNSGAGIDNLHLIMLRSDGTRNLGFNVTGKDSLNISGEAFGVLFNGDGKYLVAYSDGNYYYIRRYLSNADIDTTFGNLGEARSSALYGVNGKNLHKDNKGKIILSGTYNYYNFGAARFTENGMIDSSFANNGIYTDYPAASGNIFNSCLTADNKIFLVGEENGDAAIQKIENKQVMHILGDDYVLPLSSEQYEVKVPSSFSYTYKWEFTGSNYYFVPDSIGPKVIILFEEGATDGKLICRGYTGSIPQVVAEMDIKINNNPSQAQLLAEVQCPREVTDCYNNYISHFKLNLINNTESTCNSTGYSDFTRSEWVDTLIAGSVYSASITTESTDPFKYAAIWIDYNNDGHFDSTSEFVSQVYGEGPVLKIQNIILKNKEGYSGPKRLRVRCNPFGFDGGDACAISGEIGETEDYMIIIKEVDQLQAPEIFTPNDDGKNDFFVIRGINPEFDNSLIIMDRYGEEVYSSSNYENNWDGKNKNGEKVTPGTYYYYFKNSENAIRGFVEVRY